MQAFKPLPPHIFEQPDDHELFQSVVHHLDALLGQEAHPITNVEHLEGSPKCAKAVWYVWWFAAEVGGSGIPGYLCNHVSSMAQLRAFRSALHEIRAIELTALLESAISLYGGDIEPFVRDEDPQWLAQFKTDPVWSEWDTIEEESFRLSGAPLSTLVANYARQNRAQLTDGGA